MLLMIYARLRLLYFRLGITLQEDSGGGANPGAAQCWCSDSELQTLTNGLCETTAIDIHLISPRPSTVSTTSRLAIILWVSFFKPRYGWCQGPPRSLLLKAHPSVPQGRGERGRWEGDGGAQKVKLKASGIVKKHTLLCVFTCLLDELSYALHGWGKKKNTFLYATVWGVMEINCSHKTPSNMVQLTSFNTWDLGWLEGIAIVYSRSTTPVFLLLPMCMLHFSIPE